MDKDIEELLEKKSISQKEVAKVIRYLRKKESMSFVRIREKLNMYDANIVKQAIAAVQTEENRPRRYYVSLKDPLNDVSLR